MNRRNFLKVSAAASLYAASPKVLMADPDFNGKFLVTVHAHGGWDPTSFCDPKMNVTGESIINNWAKTQETQQAGNINYAPFGENQAFFETHHKKMLVLNGIDTQTNSHYAGEYFNMTGSMNDEYPSLAAMYASIHKAGHTMPWVTHTFRPKSGKLIAPTFLSDNNQLNRLKDLIDPNAYKYKNNSKHMNTGDLDMIRTFRDKKINQLKNDQLQMPKQRAMYAKFLESTYKDEGFDSFVNLIETADTKGLDKNNGHYRQSINAISAFKSGLAISSDIRVSNFDTHGDHDVRHANRMTELTRTVDLLWHLAELNGIEDRLVVTIVSEFGRTPRYNDKGGKDHWSTTSSVVMANNPSWGNRVIGSSTEGHRAEKINFSTMQRDDVAGIKINPNHIMRSIRDELSIGNSSESNQFALDTSNYLDIFNPNLRTV